MENIFYLIDYEDTDIDFLIDEMNSLTEGFQ